MSKKLGFAENFALSGAAAVISKTAAAPIERVKLLVQNQDEMMKAGRLSEPYKGVIDCTMRTFRTEGILPFWRGNLANCLRYFPTQALNFAFKDTIKALFKTNPGESYVKKFSKNIFSGGVAGAMSLCFVYSLDYARTRLANDAKTAGKGLTGMKLAVCQEAKKCFGFHQGTPAYLNGIRAGLNNTSNQKTKDDAAARPKFAA